MDNVLKDVPRERVVAGYRRTVRGIRTKRIRCVLLACDADESLAKSVRSLCSASDIPCHTVADKKALGEELGLDVACAVCGVTDENAKI